NFFNQTDEEKLVLYKKQKATLVEQDSHIADFLGCKDVLFIAALREVVDSIEIIQKEDNNLNPSPTDMEISFTKPVIISENYSNNTTCNNNSSSHKRSLEEQKSSNNLVEHKQETRINTLIQNEVGTLDYSLKE
ncbi:7859_t:CDS:2, partial [Dentiscutata heterogama]